MLQPGNHRRGEDSYRKQKFTFVVLLRRFSMRKRCNPVALLSLVVLICCGALILGQKVNAAGEGKITGTVKLAGDAPHMKGIDMSKDPYCTKAHANDTPKLETYVVGFQLRGIVGVGLGAVRVFRHVDALHVRSITGELDRPCNLAFTSSVYLLTQDQRATADQYYQR